MLGAFFKSMFTEWLSGMSGGMSVPLSIMAIYTSNPTQKMAFGGLAVLSFIYAAFRVFERERGRALAAEAQLDNGTPKLSIQIDGAIWEYIESEDITKVWLCVTVGNGGGPSVIRSWAAKYVSGVQELPMTFAHLGNSGEHLRGDKQFLEIKNSDLLQARTAESVIDRRSQRRGKIRVDVQGNRVDELSASQSSVRLSCSDFEGRVVTTSYRPLEPDGTLVFYPHENVKEYASPRVLFL